MTKDEALKLALEAGFRVGPSREGPDDVWGVGANLERFAKLVEEKEREACAKVCEETDDGTPYNLAKECAAAIRARGEA
jgi:hypothetical protein